MSFALAVNVRDGVDVGQLLADVIDELHMAHKECWPDAQMDGAQWSRALAGQAPLDLWHLRHLKLTVWLEFLPKLASALIRHWMADLMVPYRMAKVSELPEPQQRKERA